MSKDDRCGNGSRENRRPWAQRNATWIVLISGWLFILSGSAIKIWAQSESTTAMAIETKASVALNTGIIAQTKVDLAEIKANLAGAKEDIEEIKDEMKIGRTLLNDILRAVKR